MTTSDQITALADLLRRTSAAHGVYEQAELGGVYDQQWPQWYANWAVEHGLNALTALDLSAADWAARLTLINEQHQKADAPGTWADFTAQQIIDPSRG